MRTSSRVNHFDANGLPVGDHQLPITLSVVKSNFDQKVVARRKESSSQVCQSASQIEVQAAN
eukprot:scaffold13323_cov207-Alexandrium_tamarense.AAC.32